MQNTFDELIAWAKELKVIYVEDDAALREEVSLFLSDIFARIDTATNGLEGLEALSMNHYDLVITDIRMPEMDGISMIEALKVSHPNIPILVTSAHNESEYLLKLINLGVEHFILKPLEGDQIYRVLHSVVAKIHHEETIRRYQEDLETANAKLRQLTRLQTQSIDLQSALLKGYQEALDKTMALSLCAPDGSITEVNELFCKATGYSKEELIGKTHRFIAHPSTDEATYTKIGECIYAKKTWQGLLVNQTRTFESLYHYTTIVPILDEKGDIRTFLGIFQDIQSLKKENEVEHQQRIEHALLIKEAELLKRIPFATAIVYENLTFEASNKRFEDMVANHIDEKLLLKLKKKELHLKEFITFEEMEHFTSIQDIKDNWPYDGDITFKGSIQTITHTIDVLIRISRYEDDTYLLSLVKQEDFDLCCQVQER